MEFKREETPTIMDGLVVRWKRGQDEISASRNRVCVDCTISGEDDAAVVIATILAAKDEASTMAEANRFSNWKPAKEQP